MLELDEVETSFMCRYCPGFHWAPSYKFFCFLVVDIGFSLLPVPSFIYPADLVEALVSTIRWDGELVDVGHWGPSSVANEKLVLAIFVACSKKPCS